MMKVLLAVVSVILLICSNVYASDDILIADFEGNSYGSWKTTGIAFGPAPAKGTLPNQMQVSGFEGKGLVNSFYGGDDTTGTLTSPQFKIERQYINFLIGGGKKPGKACINLILDGNIIRTATGPNDRPGGTEALDWESWDVEDLKGKKVIIRIVDEAKGGWGHINIDHIYQSNQKMAAEVKNREILFSKRFLNLPVNNNASKRRMSVIIDGKAVREFEIQIADKQEDIDFWVWLDISEFKGSKAVLKVDKLLSTSRALEMIYQDDTTHAKEFYHEKNRQQFHFSSKRGWNNDSNGLVYYKEQYHLYYQHNPYGWPWGNMHWGHAVSTDLVHWKELPIAIYPQKFGDWVYSGSAVVDKDNTSGFKTGKEDVIVAAYTSTGRGETIAYSNDCGLTFTDYEGNPVVKHKGRDPKIIWYEPGKHWVMALYSVIDKQNTIAFYTSPDLKDWTYRSNVPGFYECPEIFELAVDGDKSNTKWIIYGADGAYMAGEFDGRKFTPDGGKIQFNYGNCFYASQTYNNIPEEDGRRIQIAWGRIDTPGMPFNQCMLFPVELTLHTTDEGLRMFANPIREISKIHGWKHSWKDISLKKGIDPLKGLSAKLLHINGKFKVNPDSQLVLNIRGTDVIYDAATQELSCKDKKAEMKSLDGRIALEILADRNSIEIFGNDGRVYMPMGQILPEDNMTLGLTDKSGKAKVVSLDIYKLNSIWK